MRHSLFLRKLGDEQKHQYTLDDMALFDLEQAR
jgi:hypothetical protein